MEQKSISSNLTNEYINTVIRLGKQATLREQLLTYHPADIAELLDEIEPENALAVFAMLTDEAASEVLDESERVHDLLVRDVDDERLADLLNILPGDDAAEFIDELEDDTAKRLLDLMEQEEADEVRELLSYPEKSAGRLMSRDVASLRKQWSVDNALDYLRTLHEAETLHYLYVVDVVGMLIGVVPIRRLILAQANNTIESIMIDSTISVQADLDQEELADLMQKYDYVALPVINKKGKLLGVVTVDDVLDALQEEVTEDIQRLGGSEPLESAYFSVTLWEVVRKRVVWLILLFVTSVATDSVLRAYEEVLLTAASLSLFIPLVTGTGGNAGSQTVATIIRAISLGNVKLQDIWRAVWREAAVGLIIGIILAFIGFLRASLWGVPVETALVLALTLPAVVITANVMSTIVPLLAERFGIDPTVVSAPLITTVVDATGLLIYFNLALLILA